MLKQIRVDGFKSLNDFTFEIRPGLNVLVGPNGAGKSNIVLFFEFLSHLANSSAMHAISRVGGAGAIFTLMPGGSLSPNISFDISGSANFHSKYKRKNRSIRKIDYKYSSNIRLSPELDNLSFTYQSIEICSSSGTKGSSGKHSLFLEWREKGDGKFTIETKITDLAFVVPFYYGLDESEKFDFKDFVSKVLVVSQVFFLGRPVFGARASTNATMNSNP